ncbi:peptidase inhibitor family I36 protein [Leucobacter triazinivorans]|uniref:Beta/gamma crystallin 'Greek key' domain-containing protein n=1 Tax=Leucobacter triazinivorans TaxID=1784719 RepID=A0A4V0Z1T4_9MICO|nr:peptidase inhibitor family I36 protein [Leucobacter triazinivorans]QBE49519.1 hypothetical protein EVS81_12315 [Leucobacter triazinivorans]
MFRNNQSRVAISGIVGAALLVGGLAAAGPANAAIDLYQYKNYGGTVYNAGHGYKPNLGTFDDKTSSLKVRGGDVATLYQFVNYSGQKSTKFSIGSPDLSTWSFPSGGTWDNRTSSVY